MTKKDKIVRLVLLLFLIGVILFASLFLTQYVSNNDHAQQIVQDYGYVSILLISLISGLNILVPIPAATFVPIFTAGGISLLVVIILLIIGTLAADIIAYITGRLGSKVTSSHYPGLQKKLVSLYSNNEKWLPYFVFGFAAFIPIPNEVYLIPLGIIGVKLQQFFIPLLLGTTLYQSLAAFGVENIFKYILL